MVAFCFGSQSINFLKNTLAVNRKSVAIRNCDIFDTAFIFLVAIGTFAVLVDGESYFANRIIAWKFVGMFRIMPVQRKHTISVMRFFYCVINRFDIIKNRGDYFVK